MGRRRREKPLSLGGNPESGPLRRAPVRWRYRLLGIVAFLWFLFLPQALLHADEPDFSFSWPGAALWLVVLVGLIWLTVRAWQRRWT